MSSTIPPDQASRSRRKLKRFLIAAIGLTGLWLLGSLIVAHHLTQRKGTRHEEPTPSVAWAEFEGLRLSTRDGHDLGAWFAEGTGQGPSVILLHGNGGNRSQSLSRAELLANEGCSVLLVTLRAHGDSSGNHNDIGYSARHDVVAAVESMERRRPGRPILILGSSLGAAAATFASGELGHRVSGYFLEAPYLDLKSAVRNRTREMLPIGLEWVAFQGLLTVAPLVAPDLEKTSPLQAIGGVPQDVPITLIAGRHDRKATPEQVGQLFDRVRSHGNLVVFENAGHLRYLQADLELYRRTLLGFLRKVVETPTVRGSR
ncbi:alpha/beta hydrolase [Tundrisphaera lichenicola]|uniref:alpha/beta hydrolase n=1 Tax=Tundrisphaera lichenicola TaxID=2029860 RepID=UPI003EC07D71